MKRRLRPDSLRLERPIARDVDEGADGIARHYPLCKSDLLDNGLALVRERGWESLRLGELAQRAGHSRDLVQRHFADVETLALEIAIRFQDEVYATAAAAIEHHPGDFAAAMRESLERFLIDLRDQRLAYVELLTGRWCPRRLQPLLRQVRERKRQRLVELWAGFHERVNGLSRRHAEGLSSFQYDALRGLAIQVDAGTVATAAAITLFIDVLAAAADRLGGRTKQKPRSDRGGNDARFVDGLR